MDQNQVEKKGCCPCQTMTPLFIVLIGLVFLARAFGYLSVGAVDIIWPILVILIGLKELTRGMCKCCDSKKCC
ncbi:MAG: DUF5668 domain-containing protein [Candidatus Parcubacteria bacterium]|nr:DUF5668 domain-containing protein [Candidatus Parcubacteria bacterium]